MTFFDLEENMKKGARITREVWRDPSFFIRWNSILSRYEWNDGIEWEANTTELNAHDWRYV